MKHKYYIITVLVFFLALSQISAQNGWTKGKGKYYFQLSTSTFSTDSYYNTIGTLSEFGNNFNSTGILLYGEYGISDRIDATLNGPILAFNSFNSTNTVAGIGDIRLGLKYRLLKSFPISIQIEAEVPTDDGIKLASAKEPNSLGIVEQINLPTSDGELNVWTTLAASQSTSDGKTFGSIYGAVNFRTQNFSNQLQAGVEVGHLFYDKLYIIGKLQIQDRFNSETSTSASFLYGEGTTYTAYNIVTMYKITEKLKVIGSYGNYGGFISKRRNMYDGGVYTIGVSIE